MQSSLTSLSLFLHPFNQSRKKPYWLCFQNMPRMVGRHLVKIVRPCPSGVDAHPTLLTLRGAKPGARKAHRPSTSLTAPLTSPHSLFSTHTIFFAASKPGQPLSCPGLGVGLSLYPECPSSNTCLSSFSCPLLKCPLLGDSALASYLKLHPAPQARSTVPDVPAAPGSGLMLSLSRPMFSGLLWAAPGQGLWLQKS